MVPLSWYLVVAFMLIGLGAYGMMVKRNLIRILIGAEIMGNGVNIALVAFSLYSPVFNLTGQGSMVYTAGFPCLINQFFRYSYCCCHSIHLHVSYCIT